MARAERGDRPSAQIPERELVTLLVYLEAGSHKAAAQRLGIKEGTSRQRIMRLMARTGTRNAAQWDVATRQSVPTYCMRSMPASRSREPGSPRWS